MTAGDWKVFAREWVEAWNSHDLTRILAHYEDDVILFSPRAKVILGSLDGTVRGKAALRDYFATALARIPELNFTLENVFSGVNSIVVEYHTNDLRHGAEFMEFGKSGHVARVVAHYAG
jgi:ketosteroid isomerase-like protein